MLAVRRVYREKTRRLRDTAILAPSPLKNNDPAIPALYKAVANCIPPGDSNGFQSRRTKPDINERRNYLERNKNK